jgi:hypothetical protein
MRLFNGIEGKVFWLSLGIWRSVKMDNILQKNHYSNTPILQYSMNVAGELSLKRLS